MITNKKKQLRVFNTIDALNEFAAQLLVDVAVKSVSERGRFVICLSGGNTPNGLYKLLSMTPYRDLIPWKNTFVFWSDERCVPADDERNNAYIASTVLLTKVNIPVTNIFPLPVDLPPVDAAKVYEASLKLFFGKEPPRFDLILLGLGGNGHTASLFPNTDVLHEKLRWVKEVYVEELRMYRVTMTPLLINQASKIFFLVTGKEKSGILKNVFLCPQPDKYPVQLIDPDNKEEYWFLDERAASLLNKEQLI